MYSNTTARSKLMAHLITFSVLYVADIDDWCLDKMSNVSRWDVPVGVPLDLSTPTGMTCIGTCVEN